MPLAGKINGFMKRSFKKIGCNPLLQDTEWSEEVNAHPVLNTSNNFHSDNNSSLDKIFNCT